LKKEYSLQGLASLLSLFFRAHMIRPLFFLLHQGFFEKKSNNASFDLAQLPTTVVIGK
jgi:hypothetical protein